MVGLSYTFLIGIYLLSHINRAERIEKLVTERTFELTTNEAFLKEIAARKQAEDELRKAHEELEIRVRERTEEVLLTNKQLLKEIFERGNAEESLRIERDKLEMVTGNIGAGLVMISKDFKTLWANDVLKKISGVLRGRAATRRVTRGARFARSAVSGKSLKRGLIRLFTSKWVRMSKGT